MNPEVVLRQLELSLRLAGAAQEEAMRVLQSYDTLPGYVPSVIYVLRAPGVDPSVKMLAVICLKNVVHRTWVSGRGTSRYTVAKEEKAMLREYLLGDSLHEPSPQLSVHLSVLLSKVSRHDWPAEWPGVLEHLYGAIQNSPDWLVRKNAMIFLMKALKELASKAMPSAKRAFAETAVQMLPAISASWRDLSGKLRVCFENPETFQVAELAIEIEELCSHLTVCVNILSRLVTRCFAVVVKESYMPAFFELLVSDMAYFAAALRSNAAGACQVAKELNCEMQLDDDSDADGGAESDGGDTDDEGGPGVDYTVAPADKRPQYATLQFVRRLRHLLRKTATIPVKLQKQYPDQMAPYLHPFLMFYMQQLMTSYGNPSTLDFTASTTLQLEGMNPTRLCELHGLAIQAVLFLSNVFSCRSYCVDHRLTNARNENAGANAVNAAADGTINSFLLSSLPGGGEETGRNSSCTEKILLLLLRSLLPWTSHDIAEWVTDPEELLLAEEGERENDSVRTAAQGLFYGLMDRSPSITKTTLRSILVQLSQNPRLPVGEGFSSTIIWEAVFLVAGLSGDKLFPHSFQEFSESGDGDGLSSPSQRADISLCTPDEWFDNILLPLIQRLIRQHDVIVASGATPPPQLLLRRLFWLMTCWLYLVPAENTELLGRILSTLVLAMEPRSCAPDGSQLAFGASGSVTVWLESAAVLQATLALQTLVNADVLDVTLLAIHFSQITSALCALTNRFEEPELCAKIVSVISDVVSSLCGRNLQPGLSQGGLRLREAGLILPLATRLYGLWQASDENSPLRSNLLDVFTKLARSAGCSSRHETKFGNIAVPLTVDMCTAPHTKDCTCCSDAETVCSLLHDMLLRIVAFSASGSGKVAHLTSSAVDLWLVIMRRSRRYTAVMDAAFTACLPRLFNGAAAEIDIDGECGSGQGDDEDSPLDVMDLMSTDIQTMFHVLESYALVYSCCCPGDAANQVVPFAVRYESIMAPVYRRVLGELRPQAVAHVIRPLEFLLLLSPEESFNFLGRNEILTFLIRACLGSPLSATPATGTALASAYAAHSEAADVTLVSYLHIIARALLLNQTVTIQVVTSLAEAVGQSAVAGMEVMMLHFIEKFDSIGFDNVIAGSWRKRIWAFAMLSVFPNLQYPQLTPLVIGDIMSLADGLQYSCPFSKVNPQESAWIELIECVAKNVLRVASSDMDDDDDDGISDDGAEYDFDSVGGKGSQVPASSGHEKATVEKDVVVEIFEKLASQDSVLTTNLEAYILEKMGQIRAVVGEEEAKKLLTF
jgi:hypothetical protein